MCVSLFWSEPGSPGPAPAPRVLSGVRGRLQPGVLGALEGQQIPAAHLEELERKGFSERGLVAGSPLVSRVHPVLLHAL